MFAPIIYLSFLGFVISPGYSFITDGSLQTENRKETEDTINTADGYKRGIEADINMEHLRREVRSTDNDLPAQIPNQGFGGYSFMTPNIQASYFLGQCVMCPPGASGVRGVQGPQGPPGRDGRDQLIIGSLHGDYQPVPEPQPPQNQNDTIKLPGAPYTRWGKTSCPETAQLIYQGVMAGSHYTHKGSGANFLCLPREPTFGTNIGGGANIYGVEYHSNLPNTNIIDANAPCVVCLAEGKQSILIIPAMNTCSGTQDWTLEYHGYMMSSHYSQTKSEFVCIDIEAEGIPGTDHDNNEGLLYVAGSQCGSSGGGLPCPPYGNGQAILCAVCSI